MQSTSDKAIHQLLQAGYRYAFALQSDAGEARGLVHDAWLRLSGRHGATPDQPLLFRTIRNIHIDGYRRGELIHFRHTDDQGEGKAIQDKYRVDTITLLLFDGQGKHLRTVVGLQSLERLQVLFQDAFESKSAHS